MGIYGKETIKSNGREITFEVTNLKEIQVNQEDDRNTYQNMLQNICDKLNEDYMQGHKLKHDKEEIWDLPVQRIKRKGELVVKFGPLSLDEKSSLHSLIVYVHKEYAITYVHEIIRNNVEDFNYLNLVNINTVYEPSGTKNKTDLEDKVN